MIDIILLGVAFAAGTLFVGWWSVPIIAVVWGWLVGPARRPAARAAIGVVLAWVGFLVFDAVRGPLGQLVRTLGETLHLPGIALIVITLLFAVILAWGAAIVGSEISLSSRVEPPSRG